MYKKHIIAVLGLLCAICFTAMGATLFSASVYPISAKAYTSSVVPASITMNAASSEKVISSSTRSIISSMPKTSSANLSSNSVSIDMPTPTAPNISSGVQKIPPALLNSSTSSTLSSDVISSIKQPSVTSSKMPTSATSSKKPIATSSKNPASSKTQTSSAKPSKPVEYLYLSINGEVKKYNAFEAVAYNVAAEMDDYYAPEALKAQAVAAHTFIAYTNSKGNAPKLPLRTPSASIQQLVKSVMDELIYYDNKLTNSVYFSMSGGETANSHEIWGGYVIPYLKKC